jgi:hypothetical protein
VMDLTPLGYSWKEHFATTHDEVVSLVVCTSWLKKKQIEFRNIIMDHGKVFLTKIGIEPSRFKAKIHKVFKSTTESILTREWKDPHPELRMYELKPNNLLPLAKETDISVTRNSINDLLSFRPVNSDPSIGEFLSNANELFKKGAVSYSAVQNNDLVANGWILKNQIDIQLLHNKATITLPIKGTVFLNLYSHHEISNLEINIALLTQMLKEACTVKDHCIYAFVESKNLIMRSAIESMNFEYIKSYSKKYTTIVHQIMNWSQKLVLLGKN